jgi:polysaccharide biosynthesis protein PslG
VRLSPWIGGAVAVAAVTFTVAAAASGGGAAEPAAGDAVGATDDLVVGVIPQRPVEAGEGYAMRRAGIDSTRVWISWAEVEANRGEYDWSRPDALIQAVIKEGLGVLPLLYGSPAWAAQEDGYVCFGTGCIAFAPASAETRTEFAEFAAAAVRRYGPEGAFWSQHPSLPSRPMPVWQVWNEQNMDAFFRPQADPDAYAELLAPAAEQIRDVDPDAEILIGGMFGPEARPTLIKATRYLRALYHDRRVAGSFDGVAIHPYSGSALGSLAQIRAVLRTIRRRGSGEELWVTEIGWASGGRPGEPLVKDRRKQARLLRRTFSRFAAKDGRWNLGGAFWYAWRDSVRGEPVCAWCPRAGLISRSGLKKPAYRALRRVLADAR